MTSNGSPGPVSTLALVDRFQSLRNTPHAAIARPSKAHDCPSKAARYQTHATDGDKKKCSIYGSYPQITITQVKNLAAFSGLAGATVRGKAALRQLNTGASAKSASGSRYIQQPQIQGHKAQKMKSKNYRRFFVFFIVLCSFSTLTLTRLYL